MFIIPYRTSCHAVIGCYYRNTAPPYLGFNTEEHAQTSFAAFQASGQLPAGLFSSASLQPLDGSPVPSLQSLLSLTPQRCAMTPTSALFAAVQASGQHPGGLFSSTSLRPLNGSPVPSSQSPLLLTPHHRHMTPTSMVSRTAVNPSIPCAPHTSVRAASQVQSAFTSQTSVRPAHQIRGTSGSTSNSPRPDPLSPIASPLSPMGRNITPASVLFYVVIEGDTPGVYRSQ